MLMFSQNRSFQALFGRDKYKFKVSEASKMVRSKNPVKLGVFFLAMLLSVAGSSKNFTSALKELELKLSPHLMDVKEVGDLQKEVRKHGNAFDKYLESPKSEEYFDRLVHEVFAMNKLYSNDGKREGVAMFGPSSVKYGVMDGRNDLNGAMQIKPADTPFAIKLLKSSRKEKLVLVTKNSDSNECWVVGFQSIQTLQGTIQGHKLVFINANGATKRAFSDYKPVRDSNKATLLEGLMFQSSGSTTCSETGGFSTSELSITDTWGKPSTTETDDWGQPIVSFGEFSSAQGSTSDSDLESAGRRGVRPPLPSYRLKSEPSEVTSTSSEKISAKKVHHPVAESDAVPQRTKGPLKPEYNFSTSRFEGTPMQADYELISGSSSGGHRIKTMSPEHKMATDLERMQAAFTRFENTHPNAPISALHEPMMQKEDMSLGDILLYRETQMSGNK